MMKRIQSLAGILVLLVTAHESSAQDRVGVAFFESKIRPVLVKHCYQCHSAESGKARGGLKVDTRDALFRGGDSGPAIAGRSAASSLLFQSVKHTGDYEMPPSGKLPDEVIADIRRWIEMGAPDPRVIKSVADVKTQIDIAAGRDYWAYQPIKRPTPPSNDASWARTDIDQFVAARRDAEGLKPVRDAESSVLVRRLFFTLTGLPPSMAAARHWASRMDSQGEDAVDQTVVEELVDGLLGTRFFGERWGRHWMDVARYAESSGGDANNIHQHAWRYRDYVIDAFNDDKPFDRFILEQLAGDLLPIGSDSEWADNVIATGFLAVGLKLVGEEDQQRFFADLVDEQVDATTRAFLATSVACARCHDHKFDPIPQSDYYALAGIFRSTETHYGMIKAQARQATTLLDLTGMGPPPATSQLATAEYRQLVKARDDARQTVDDAMRKIRSGENVFRGTLRRIRSDRDETEAALQAFLPDGTPRVFAMGTQDKDYPLPTRLLLRGEIDKPAQLVPRGFLQVLTAPGRNSLGPRTRGSGRLELARWIADPRNPLTARVIVNRVWHWMFGRGLVRTVDDFGRTGDVPSHPELLDHLAFRFIEDGWSIKSLIREIALSRTWQLASDYDAELYAVDPDNRLMWRMNKRRLEGEAVRDAMLAAAGTLDTKRPLGTFLKEVGEGTVGQNVFEPVIRAIESPHRSVYLPRVRSVLPEFLELLDAPDAGAVSGMRDSTSTPLQSLYMMNHPWVARQSASLAESALAVSEDDRIEFVFMQTLARPPSESERALALELRQQLRREGLDEPAAFAAFCQTLFCTEEFRTLD